MGLAYKELEMIVPHKPSPRSFLKQMGMFHNPSLLCLKEGWISLEFLYSLFGEEEGHQNFHREFACSSAKRERYHLNAFAVTLLGSLPFPRESRKIHTSLVTWFVCWLEVGRLWYHDTCRNSKSFDCMHQRQKIL